MHVHSPVLISSPLQPKLAAELIARHGAVEVPGPGIRVAVTTARYGFTAEQMDGLPDLEAIVSFGVGLDAIDLDAARARTIAVANTPDVLTDAVADLAVGLLIDVVREISTADRYVRAGRWITDGEYRLTGHVTGRRVGVIGLGRIGQAIADRLAGFRCEIGYHNRSARTDVAYQWFPSAVELADWAEVVVIAAPGGSTPIVGAAELSALGANGVLVNIGRGSIVDEDALVQALVQGTIAGAGLDVYAHEPRVPEALLALDQVVLVPHMGSGTRQTRQEMAELVLDNVGSFLERGELVTGLW